MSLSEKTGISRWLISSILIFVCAGICISKARKFASAAPSEMTTTAHVFSVEHSIFRRLRFNYYRCSYNFSVDGAFNIDNSDCPQEIVDDAVKGKYSDSSATSTSATVYYDPTDLSVNSLLEFSAASENEYRAAMPFIGLGTIIIFFYVFGRLLTANERTGNGGVVVDARGTVIYPEEIGLGSEFAGLPSGGAVNFPSSPGLRELYLEAVNNIHPDRAANEVDRALRERLMKEANAAFERGDAETLRRVLEEYRGAIPAS
jgi:hypothetical protein